MSDEPEITTEPEAIAEPEVTAEPESTTEPEVPAATETPEDALGSLFAGMDESIFDAADAMVNANYLDTPAQQSAITRMRERALSIYQNYQDDAWFRAEASVRLSANINVLYCAYQMIQAIRYGRVWFIALAMYGAMVATTRLTIIRYLQPDAEDGREELERYRNCGLLMVMLAFAVTFLAMVVNYAGEHPVYPGSMIWVVGAYTLYMVYASVANLIEYRKLESPLISASKQVSMACAMTSLYSLQAAALALYAVDDWVWLRNRLNTISAVVICVIIFIFAIHIINRASRALAGKEDLSFVVQAKVKEVGDDNRYEWQRVHAAEAQRQLEYWRGKEKVEWHTQGGAMQRHDEEVRKLLQDREERKEQRRKKRM
jgi:hypothetical protein